MGADDDIFRRLEAEIGELPPGTVVEYHGPMVEAHGLWVVRVQVADARYTLAHPVHEWQRLNADRDDLTRTDL